MMLASLFDWQSLSKHYEPYHRNQPVFAKSKGTYEAMIAKGAYYDDNHDMAVNAFK